MKAVAIVGLGCVGSRTARLLKGKARLLLIDFDDVRIENLGCQLYSSKDFKEKKAIATAKKTKGIAIVKKLTAKNAAATLGKASVIVDCTDDWQARKTIDDYCKKAGKPWIYAGALRSQAMVSTITNPGNFAKWAKKTPRVSCHVVGISTKACEWAAKTQSGEVRALLKGRELQLDGKIAFYDAETKEKAVIHRRF